MDDYRRRIENGYENFELQDSVKAITELVTLGNQHIHEKETWRQNNEDASITMNNVSYIMQTAAELYEPIIPDGAMKAKDAIEKGEKIILFLVFDENIIVRRVRLCKVYGLKWGNRCSSTTSSSQNCLLQAQHRHFGYTGARLFSIVSQLYVLILKAYNERQINPWSVNLIIALLSI